jgi:DNA mismatch endonuclease, patch repair protein
MDHVSAEDCSRMMAAVRSKGNRSTEVALGRLLSAVGLRGYRKHWSVPGTPDFAWPVLQVAVFVDGCFWHGCSCKTIPKTNRRFWCEKIRDNQRRDQRVTRQLRRQNWKVIRIKECAIGKMSTVLRIHSAVAARRRAQTTGKPTSLFPHPRATN